MIMGSISNQKDVLTKDIPYKVCMATGNEHVVTDGVAAERSIPA
jgi:hypothetical protein